MRISTDGQTSALSRNVLDWVALMERLGEDDRDGFAAHLRSLDESDRRLRFGVAVDDEFIERYVHRIDFRKDIVFGVRSGPGEWIGVGHLVVQGRTSELGLSVLSPARGRGLGGAILRFAAVRAARAAASRLYMHFLTSNRAILAIARRAGMAIESESGEADAHLVVPPIPEFVRQLIQFDDEAELRRRAA
jgi:RimJ/RimL family protein N-acetyltransferase